MKLNIVFSQFGFIILHVNFEYTIKFKILSFSLSPSFLYHSLSCSLVPDIYIEHLKSYISIFIYMLACLFILKAKQYLLSANFVKDRHIKSAFFFTKLNAYYISAYIFQVPQLGARNIKVICKNHYPHVKFYIQDHIGTHIKG